MRPGFAINMSPLGSDHALSELLWMWIRTHLGCNSTSPSVGSWCGSAAGEHSAPLFPSKGHSPRVLLGQEQELSQDITQFRFQQQRQKLGKVTMGTVTQHLLHTPFCILLLYTKPRKATFVATCIGWYRAQFPSTLWWVKSWKAADDCGHSPWSDHLCHPLDNSVVIPKDLRVAHAVPSFDKLNYSLASSMDCYL